MININKDWASHLHWWNKYRNCDKLDLEALKLFSSLSIYADKVFTQEDWEKYFEICSNTIHKLFEHVLENYKFFWYTGVEIDLLHPELNPRVAHYKKVWKKLRSDFSFQGFNFGPEFEIAFKANKRYYIGISSFSSNYFPRIGRELWKMLRRGVIFASEENHLLTTEFLQNFAHISHRVPKEGFYFYDFDYIAIIKNFCPQGAIIFVYENNSENENLFLVMNEEKIELIKPHIESVKSLEGGSQNF